MESNHKDMADHTATGNELEDEIYDQFLVCKICFQIYRRPKSLNCLHIFCAECLEKYQDAEHERSYRYFYNRTIACPICRKKTELPSGGVTRLPDNFLIDKLIEVINRKRSRSPLSDQQVCEICKPSVRYRSSAIALSKCIDCSKLLCRKCVDLHRRTKVTQGHSLFDTDVEKTVECKVHKDEMVRYYCEPCEMCICVVCTFQEHKGHEVSTFSQGLSKHRPALDSLLEECRNRIGELEGHYQMIQKCEKEIKDTESHIRKMAADSIEAIHKKEEQMLEDLHAIYGDNTMQFLKSKDEIEKSIETLQNTHNITDVILKDQSIELLLLKSEIHQRLESLMKSEVRKPPYNLQRKVNFKPGKLVFGCYEVDDVMCLPRNDCLSDDHFVSQYENLVAKIKKETAMIGTSMDQPMFDYSNTQSTQTLATRVQDQSTVTIEEEPVETKSIGVLVVPDVIECHTMTNKTLIANRRTQTERVIRVNQSTNTRNSRTRFYGIPLGPVGGDTADFSVQTDITSSLDQFPVPSYDRQAPCKYCIHMNSSTYCDQLTSTDDLIELECKSTLTIPTLISTNSEYTQVNPSSATASLFFTDLSPQMDQANNNSVPADFSTASHSTGVDVGISTMSPYGCDRGCGDNDVTTDTKEIQVVSADLDICRDMGTNPNVTYTTQCNGTDEIIKEHKSTFTDFTMIVTQESQSESNSITSAATYTQNNLTARRAATLESETQTVVTPGHNIVSGPLCRIDAQTNTPSVTTQDKQEYTIPVVKQDKGTSCLPEMQYSSSGYGEITCASSRPLTVAAMQVDKCVMTEQYSCNDGIQMTHKVERMEKAVMTENLASANTDIATKTRMYVNVAAGSDSIATRDNGNDANVDIVTVCDAGSNTRPDIVVKLYCPLIDMAIATDVRESIDASTGTAVHESIDASTGTDVHESNDASTGTAVHECIDASTGTDVHESIDASTGTVVHESNDASTGTDVHESNDASTGTAVHESIDASTGTAVHESNDASTGTDVHESNDASTGTDVHESIDASTSTAVHESIDASTGTAVHESNDASTGTDVHESNDASTGTDVHESIDSSTGTDVHGSIDASTGPDNHASNDASTGTDVFESIDASTGTDVHESIDSSTGTDVHESIDASTGPDNNESNDASTGTDVFESIDSSTGTDVHECIDASIGTDVHESIDSSTGTDVPGSSNASTSTDIMMCDAASDPVSPITTSTIGTSTPVVELKDSECSTYPTLTSETSTSTLSPETKEYSTQTEPTSTASCLVNTEYLETMEKNEGPDDRPLADTGCSPVVWPVYDQETNTVGVETSSVGVGSSTTTSTTIGTDAPCVATSNSSTYTSIETADMSTYTEISETISRATETQKTDTKTVQINTDEKQHLDQSTATDISERKDQSTTMFSGVNIQQASCNTQSQELCDASTDAIRLHFTTTASCTDPTKCFDVASSTHDVITSKSVSTTTYKLIATQDAAQETSPVPTSEIGTSVDVVSRSDSTTMTHIKTNDVGVLKRPHTISRGLNAYRIPTFSRGTATSFNTTCQATNTEVKTSEEKGILSKPFDLCTQETNTEKEATKDAETEMKFQSMCDRATSPLVLFDSNKGIHSLNDRSPIQSNRSEEVKPQVSSIGTNTDSLNTHQCPCDDVHGFEDIYMENSLIVAGDDTNSETPLIVCLEKETSTSQVCMISKYVATDNTITEDKGTLTSHDNFLAVDHLAPHKVTLINQGTSTLSQQVTSRETSPVKALVADKASSPVRIPTHDKGVMAKKGEIIEPVDTFQAAGVQRRPNKPIYDSPRSSLASITEDLKESGSSSDEEDGSSAFPLPRPRSTGSLSFQLDKIPSPKRLSHKEAFFVQSGPRLGLSKSFTGKVINAPRIILAKVEAGTNTPGVKNSSTGTSTIPVDTADKAVCTEAVAIENKMAQCISKLKTVRERLEQQPIYVQSNVKAASCDGAPEVPKHAPPLQVRSKSLGDQRDSGNQSTLRRPVLMPGLLCNETPSDREGKKEALARRQQLEISHLLAAAEAVKESRGGDNQFSKPRLRLQPVQRKVLPKLNEFMGTGPRGKDTLDKKPAKNM